MNTIFLASMDTEGPLPGRRVLLEGPDCRAEIALDTGANLYACMLEGWQMLLHPIDFSLPHGAYGMPVMFPYANRLTDAAFTFEGRRYEMQMNGKPVVMHGLVGEASFTCDALHADDVCARASMRFTIAPGTPQYETYPFHLRLSMTYTLREKGLKLDWRVENLGEGRAPMGFGIHTFLRKTEHPEEIRVTVSAPCRMETHECYPSGVVLDVTDTTFDLRSGRVLSELDLDHLYYLRDWPAQASVEYLREGVQTTLEASENMRYMVVFTPESIAEGFCLENQTNATDGHNLYSRGFRDESGLIILEAGQACGGYITLNKRR